MRRRVWVTFTKQNVRLYFSFVFFQSVRTKSKFCVFFCLESFSFSSTFLPASHSLTFSGLIKKKNFCLLRNGLAIICDFFLKSIFSPQSIFVVSLSCLSVSLTVSHHCYTANITATPRIPAVHSAQDFDSIGYDWL